MERRSSTRLARKRSLDGQLPVVISGAYRPDDGNAARNSNNNNNHHHHLHRHHHRPKAGASPTQNDCGVLPGE
jgi:hypothetical protein